MKKDKNKTSYENADGRFYPDFTTKGVKYPSVTTILDVLNKPALVQWAANLVAAEALKGRESVYKGADILLGRPESDDEYLTRLKRAPYASRSYAAAVGTHVHAVADAEAKGLPWPEAVSAIPSDLIQNHVVQFNRWRDDYNPEFLYTEVEVVNRTVGYGGRFDSFLRIAGEVYMVDLKTGKDIYPEVALQLTAYDHSEEALLGGKLFKMPKADKLAVLHLREDAWHFRVLKPTTPPDLYWEAFKAARRMWEWNALMKSSQWLESEGDAGDPLIVGG